MPYYTSVKKINGELRLQGRPVFVERAVRLPFEDPEVDKEFETQEEMFAYFKEHGIMTSKMYHAQHCACPKCGSERYSTTFVGYVSEVDRFQNHIDKNRIRCECGFTGITHDLVSRK